MNSKSRFDVIHTDEGCRMFVGCLIDIDNLAGLAPANKVAEADSTWCTSRVVNPGLDL